MHTHAEGPFQSLFLKSGRLAKDQKIRSFYGKAKLRIKCGEKETMIEVLRGHFAEEVWNAATTKWGSRIQWTSLKGMTCFFDAESTPRFKAAPIQSLPNPTPQTTKVLETKTKVILRLGFQEVPFKALLRMMDRSILDKARSTWGKSTQFSYSHGNVYYFYNPELKLASRSMKKLRTGTLKPRIPVTIHFRNVQCRTNVSEACPITSAISKASSYWHCRLYCWKIENGAIYLEQESRSRRKQPKSVKRRMQGWISKLRQEMEIEATKPARSPTQKKHVVSMNHRILDWNMKFGQPHYLPGEIGYLSRFSRGPATYRLPIPKRVLPSDIRWLYFLKMTPEDPKWGDAYMDRRRKREARRMIEKALLVPREQQLPSLDRILTRLEEENQETIQIQVKGCPLEEYWGFTTVRRYRPYSHLEQRLQNAGLKDFYCTVNSQFCTNANISHHSIIRRHMKKSMIWIH
jgi:hypothetical protein